MTSTAAASGAGSYAALIVPRVLPILLLALAAALAGCGEDRAATPRESVRLTLSEPRDAITTREQTTRVSGSVSPSTARVLVLGERVAVSDGRFSTSVDLDEGSNVIDIGASAPRRRATWRALRISRRSTIELPDVAGQDITEAVKALEALGLKVSVKIDEGLLDSLRRRPRVICRSDPASGSQVQPDSEVELLASKSC